MSGVFLPVFNGASFSGWVVRAFSANRPGADPRLYLASYDSALEILDWGRTGPWKNVSTRDKGIVFENHFVRAMRRMRLDAFMSVCAPLNVSTSLD